MTEKNQTPFRDGFNMSVKTPKDKSPKWTLRDAAEAYGVDYLSMKNAFIKRSDRPETVMINSGGGARHCQHYYRKPELIRFLREHGLIPCTPAP